VTTVQNVSVEAIGETNATAPGWVSGEIARFDTALVGNGSVVALTHTGGKTVEDPGLLFYTSNVSTQTTVNGTLEPSETVYVYLTADDDSNQSLLTSINERPAVNESFVNLRGGNLSVSAHRHVTDTYDSGVTLQVEIRERPGAVTARNATAEPPRAAGESA